MDLLISQYHSKMIEITESFNFFKANTSIADFNAELRHLDKMCNFGQYLDAAIRDHFVCGLHDKKYQQELLGIPDLTVVIALQKATAAEVVCLGKQQECRKQCHRQIQVVIFISRLLRLNVTTVAK